MLNKDIKNRNNLADTILTYLKCLLYIFDMCITNMLTAPAAIEARYRARCAKTLRYSAFKTPERRRMTDLPRQTSLFLLIGGAL
jgi:hypothetical protein